MNTIFDSHAHGMCMSVSDIGVSVGPGYRFFCFDFLS